MYQCIPVFVCIHLCSSVCVGVNVCVRLFLIVDVCMLGLMDFVHNRKCYFTEKVALFILYKQFIPKLFHL